MNLTRCSHGHFYDASTYQHCPHCGAQAAEPANETRALPDYPDMTEKISGPSLEEAVKNAANSTSAPVVSPSVISGASSVAEDSKTVGFFSKSMSSEPVVGWLVCAVGSNRGKDYRLKSGRNFIGRSAQMDVSIAGDNTVSRDRHAIVVYDPKTHMFLVQPGDSKELCYLNDEVVLTPQAIKINDVITVGSTRLMFFPCCNATFNWGQVAGDSKDN